MENSLTISEVSKLFNITASTLRYYESMGLMDPVKRNASGHRYYTEHDLRRINFIKTMKNAGITIEQIKLYVDLFHEGEHTIPQRKTILIQQLDILYQKAEDLQNIIHELEDTIENYENTLVKREMDRRRLNKAI